MAGSENIFSTIASRVFNPSNGFTPFDMSKNSSTMLLNNDYSNNYNRLNGSNSTSSINMAASNIFKPPQNNFSNNFSNNYNGGMPNLSSSSSIPNLPSI
jgi:hypothetical protein